MTRSTPSDYRGVMTPEKADRLIMGWETDDVILAITGGQSLIRDHTIRLGGPLPSALIMDALARRIRLERHPGHGSGVLGCASCERSALGARVAAIGA